MANLVITDTAGQLCPGSHLSSMRIGRS